MKYIILTSVIFIIGCAAPQPQEELKREKLKVVWVDRIPWDKAELDKISTEGSNTVKMQAFTKTVGGDSRYADNIVLRRVEPLATQYVDVNIRGIGPNNGLSWLKPYEDYKEFEDYLDNSKLWFFGETDADGNYIFEDVPNGEYYAIARIYWKVGNKPQGGFLFKKIKVQEPFTKNKIPIAAFPPNSSMERINFILNKFNKRYPKKKE
jgi:hypothetical protein